MIPILLDHLWQSTLFAACAGILTLTLRNNSASIRYWLWFSASAKFLIPFSLFVTIGSHVILPLPTTVADSPVVDTVLQVAQPFSAVSSAQDSAYSAGLSLAAIVGALWAAGFAVVTLLGSIRWSRITAAIRSATPFTSRPPLPLSVKSSESIVEPALVGIWRPVLLLKGIETRLSDVEMDAIFAHELCHMRRRDNLTAAIHLLVEAVFWFYPLVWWLRVRLIAERERACDESVVALGIDPQIYAEGVLKVCRFYVQSPLACASGVSGADLRGRVEAIMDNRPSIKLMTAQKLLLATFAAGAIASPFIVGIMATQHAVAQTQNEGASLLPEEIAKRRAEQAQVRTAIPIVPKEFDRFVGFYQLGPAMFFTISRQNDHFLTRLTGQTDVEIYPERPTKFFAKVVPAQISFTTDAQGNVNELVLHQNGFEQHARKVDEAVAKAADAAVQKRIAEGKPDLERQELLSRYIAADQKGEIPADIMSPALTGAVKAQWPLHLQMNQRLGKFISMQFLHVDQQGWDVYDTTYEHAHVVWNVAPLTADHKLAGLLGR